MTAHELARVDIKTSKHYIIITLSCSRERRVEMISERIIISTVVVESTSRPGGRSGYSRSGGTLVAPTFGAIGTARSILYGAELDISKNTTVRVGLGRKFVFINKRMTRNKLRVCTGHDVVMIALLCSSSTVFYFVSTPTHSRWLVPLPHTHTLETFRPIRFSRFTLAFYALLGINNEFQSIGRRSGLIVF